MLAHNVTDLTEPLRRVCQALLAADPDIAAIVQFGSSCYAPQAAIDVDLMVATKQCKDYGVYLDATVGTPFPVDVIPCQTDSKPGRDIAASVKAVGRLLHGDWETVERMVRDVPVPSYAEARELVSNADEDLQLAPKEPTPVRREGRYRTAFNGLFDSARLAAMAFLNTEETRWGELKGDLPEPYASRFRSIITELHVIIFYRRELPLVDIEAEYERWRGAVLQFINDLEAAGQS